MTTVCARAEDPVAAEMITSVSMERIASRMIVPPRVSRESVILPHAVREGPMAVICGTRLPLRCVRAVATLIPALALLACDPRTSEQKPEFVYLRTDSVTVAVTVRSAPTVAVGDWLRLNASRSTSEGWR